MISSAPALVTNVRFLVVSGGGSAAETRGVNLLSPAVVANPRAKVRRLHASVRRMPMCTSTSVRMSDLLEIPPLPDPVAAKSFDGQEATM